jgi:Cu/Ag efflux protein CusF
MNIRKILSAAILAIAVAGTASAATFTKATVKKIDAKAGKVTLIHEELVDLEMPAMTMVFVLADPAMVEQLAVGDEIEFIAERVNGKLTVTELR